MAESGDVGLVTPVIERFQQDLPLAGGQTLHDWQLIVETYGTLNAAASNAVLICHALSGHHHAAGRHSDDDRKPGWWDALIGPGKPIDTDRFFVVSLNNLGGCHGSTGPSTINSLTGKPWGPEFPKLQVIDWVHSQALLADRLGIQQWAAVIGGSLGGMQALQWAVEFPERVRHCAVLAAAPKLTAQNIAFNEIARHAIITDPDWRDGHYMEHDTLPERGLALARMVGHLTYMSEDGMSDKFGREIRAEDRARPNDDEVVFQVESYLRYQGSQFSTRFDANTYILMTRALDYFDIAAGFNGNLNAAMASTQARFLVISFSSDWRFPPSRSREIVDALIAAGKPVSYADIHTDAGHDGFLLDEPHYRDLFRAWMQQVTC